MDLEELLRKLSNEQKEKIKIKLLTKMENFDAFNEILKDCNQYGIDLKIICLKKKVIELKKAIYFDASPSKQKNREDHPLIQALIEFVKNVINKLEIKIEELENIKRFYEIQKSQKIIGEQHAFLPNLPDELRIKKFYNLVIMFETAKIINIPEQVNNLKDWSKTVMMNHFFKEGATCTEDPIIHWNRHMNWFKYFYDKYYLNKKTAVFFGRRGIVNFFKWHFIDDTDKFKYSTLSKLKKKNYPSKDNKDRFDDILKHLK